MRAWVTRRAVRVHEDCASLDMHSITVDVVRPRVEGRAGRDVEARVVPVAVEEAVVDVAPVQREAHVWAAVVDGVELAPVKHHQHRRVADRHHVVPGRLDLVDGPRNYHFAHTGPIVAACAPRRNRWIHISPFSGTDRVLSD